MGYDIGPRIGIQGEKEFNNQIRQINNSLKEYGSEMKALSSKFSENANSQEALVAKTKTLQKQYDTQKQKSEVLQSQYDKEVAKLKELANAYKKAKEENGETSAEAAKAETAYNKQTESVSKLKVAMNETEGYMNSLQSTIKSNEAALSQMDAGTRDAVTGLNDLGDSASATGDKLDEISEKISSGNLMEATEKLSGVGDKIQAMGETAVSSFQSIEDATVKVNARFGETGKAAEANAKLIKDVYESGLGDSINSVSEAVILVKDNLKDLNDTDMRSIVEQGLILQDTYGIDMSESIRGINALMQHFEISATDAMDLLVAGTQNGLDKTNELGDNLSEYSGKFKEAGYSADEYFQLLQNGLDAGAYNLDKVNDSINEVTTKLGDGSIADSIGSFSTKTQELFASWQSGGATQKDVINSIVADINGCTNQQEALNLASTAFGTLAEDGGIKVISALSSVGDGYTDVSGKANEMQENTTTSSQKMEAAMRKIEDSFAPLGETIAGTIENLTPVAEKIAGIIEGFANLPAPVQMLILAILGIISTVSKLAPVLASLKALGIGTALGGLGPLITGTVIPAIGGALAAAAPVVLVIAGIVAAIAGVVLAIKNWDAIVAWFKEKVGAAIEAVKGFFQGLGDKIGAIKDAAVSKITALKDGAVEKFQALKEGASEKIESLKASASEKFESIKSSISTKLDTAKTKAASAFGSIADAAKSKLETAKSKVSSAIDTIKGIFDKFKPKFPEIKIPKIKLPHFSIKGKFSLSPPSIPHFSVKWNKEGGILSGAQIFGRIGNTLMGGGEAGREAVLPLTSFYDELKTIITGALQGTGRDYSGSTQVQFAPVTNVYVGNKEFDSYIVETSKKGITQTSKGYKKGRGI